MSNDIGPTPLGKFVMFLFVIGCIFAAAVSFSPELKEKIFGGSAAGDPGRRRQVLPLKENMPESLRQSVQRRSRCG